MKLWLIALTLLLSACPKGSTPPPVDNTGGGGASEAGECQSDDDCVVSCSRPNECCDQLCPPCEQAFSKAELEAHLSWQGPACAATSCPVAKCMAPTEETFAKCEAGQCVTGRKPFEAP